MTISFIMHKLYHSYQSSCLIGNENMLIIKSDITIVFIMDYHKLQILSSRL